jgi:AcrR family transcriptional regulator
MASRNQKSKKPSKVNAEKILTAALNRAEVEGWQNIRLHDIADDLGTSLPVVREHFRDQDAIANAWFRKCLDAMLAPTEKAFRDLPAKQRLYLVIMRWLDAMAVHRRVTVQMIRTKLYLGHPHHWVPLVFNLSRLVNWIREAAFLDAQGRQRQFEEIGLTTLVVTTLGVWATDQSEDQERTRRFFRRRLETGDRVMSRLFR